MAQTYDIQEQLRDESTIAKQRFESFRLGGNGLQSNLPPKHSHGRSHSRKISISSTASLSTFTFSPNPSSVLPLSSATNFDKTTNDTPSPATLPLPPTNRNSHHRRRSSVSTRTESAEMMGVPVPELSTTFSDENVNFGEKDSVRRRALWALEGKPEVAFSPVEIPDISTPVIEKLAFEFPTKPSFTPAPAAGFGSGISNHMPKRDSFKLLPGSGSSKDQLHTLLEEEEEEEEDNDITISAHPTELDTNLASTLSIIKSTPPRSRPTNLNLRPLSLTPDTLVASAGLPTPTSTPKTSPLKALSLVPSPTSSFDNNDLTAVRRHSLVVTPSPGSPHGLARRPSLHLECESPSQLSLEEAKVKKRSSISYKASGLESQAGLPTPDATPIHTEFLRRPSSSSATSSDEDFRQGRPLSASEQHFLFKQHNALLTRIMDLERALSSRPRSRPMSYASDTSSVASFDHDGPTDEMLQLVADLKAERDELKRDVDGWRMRVGDLQKQVGVVASRIDVERREAWVARSRIGLVEVEKAALEKALTEALARCDAALNERDESERKLRELHLQVKRGQEAEAECLKLRAALAEQMKITQDLKERLKEAESQAASSAYGPAWSSGPEFEYNSTDSGRSSTEVDEGSSLKPLKSIAEEDMEEDNGLAGYEDEDDFDVSFGSQGDSSFGSLDETPRSTAHLKDAFDSSASARSAAPIPSRPSRGPDAFISKTWTFPFGHHQLPPQRDIEEVDHFFGCLADDVSPPTYESLPSQESSKGLFSQALKLSCDEDNDALPPFVLPCNVGVEIIEIPDRELDVVMEEEEEVEEDHVEEFMEEMEISGIKFTFTPPAPEDESLPSFVLEEMEEPEIIKKPVFEPFDDEEDSSTPFNFGRSSASTSSMDMFFSNGERSDEGITESPVSPKCDSRSYSSIPRPSRSFTMPSGIATSTPPRAAAGQYSSPSTHPARSFVTPPPKRGGAMPSFIPQPVSSPPRNPSPAKQRPAPPSFIRQPSRKPIPTASTSSSSKPLGSSNGSRSNSQLKYTLTSQRKSQSIRSHA